MELTNEDIKFILDTQAKMINLVIDDLMEICMKCGNNKGKNRDKESKGKVIGLVVCDDCITKTLANYNLLQSN